MILTIYGTTGELIKLAPVLHGLREHGHDYLSATTGQQARQIPALLDGFGLPQPDLWLARGAGGRDLRTQRDIPRWASHVFSAFARSRGRLRRELRAGPGKPVVLVHGDTMTTVLGALMGRALGFPVAHVEAGLRSFDLRNPFPEELNRRLTSAVATIQYAPGPWAAGNLRRGRIVDTGSNTVRDSLALVTEVTKLLPGLPEPPFGIVSLHRYELLNDRRLLAQTLSLLADHAREVPLVFVDHPVTVAALERFGLERYFGERFVRVPRLTFLEFVPVMRRSAFLFTDSGGSQEECFYLDLPCLVHRRSTERREGIGENVVLSRYDEAVAADFLADPGRFRRTSELPAHSPSDAIVRDLEAAGFV